MSEKVPNNFPSEEAASAVPMSEIIELAKTGFLDQAITLSNMKLELFKKVVSEIEIASQQKEGIISKEDWLKEQAFIEEQIAELEAFLATAGS
jgi:uncharacterized protein YqgQ